MRATARLRRLEREIRPALGQEVIFPGRTDEEADQEARAMIERGEIAEDDMVLGHPKEPFGPPWIRKLPCTNAEYRAWLETLPEG